MASTYVNNLRLNEMATGDASGTWGTTTNTNLELVGQALGYGTEGITTNANTHTSTVADGAADEARAMYIKYTGTLDSACTITIGPNTLKRVHIIENATSGSQNIIIKQGSGATVTIGNGNVSVVTLDGAGSGAAVLNAFTDLETAGTITVAGNLIASADATVGDDLSLVSDAAVLGFGADTDVTLTHVADTGLLLNSSRQLQFGDSGTYIHQSADGTLDLVADTEIEINATTIDMNGALNLSGNALVSGEVQTANIGYTDGDNAIVIADGGGITAANGITSTAASNTFGATSFNDADITNVGSIALDTIINDGTDITLDSGRNIIFDADGGDFTFKDGGTTQFQLQNSSGDVQLVNNTQDKDIKFMGDDGGSTITALTLDMSAAGAATFTGAITANAGVVVDNFTLDGNTLALSSGDFTLDVAGEIELDANGGKWLFKDDGTQIGRIENTSSNLIIKSSVNDKDIIFNGEDGGSNITALTLDMSAAGAATFNSTINTTGITAQTGGTGAIANVVNFNASGNGGSGRGTGILIGAPGSNSVVSVAKIAGLQETAASTANNASLAFQVAASDGTLTERMRITNTGAVSANVTRTSSSSATILTLKDNVTGGQTDGVYKAIRSESNGTSSVSEIRFIESDGTNNNTAIGFATAASAGAISEKMRIHPAGVVSFLSGIELGSGLDASASNTLDDYEEGTWTVVVEDSSGNDCGLSGETGHYTKIGNLVYVIFGFTVNSRSGVGNGIQVNGLPFDVENVTEGSGEPSGGYITFANNLASTDFGGFISTRANNSTTFMELKFTTAGAQTGIANNHLAASQMTDSTYMTGHCTYRTA